MNKLLTLLTFCVACNAFGQDNTKKYEYIHPGDFVGVFEVGTNKGFLYFTERLDGDRDAFQFTTVNQSGEILAKEEVVAPANSTLIEVLPTKDRTVLFFVAPDGTNLHLTSINPDGHIFKNAEINPETPSTLSWSRPNVDAHGNTLYYTRNWFDSGSDKRGDETHGFKVWSLEQDLNPKLIYEITANVNESIPTINQIVAGPSHCALMTYISDYSARTYLPSVQILEKSTGSGDTYALTSENKIYHPFTLMFHENELILTGVYFTDNWYSAPKADGLFFTSISATGEVKNHTAMTYESLKTSYNTDKNSQYLFEGSRKLLFHEALPTPTGFMIIAETYAKSSGANALSAALEFSDGIENRALTIYDYVIIQMDKTGKVTGIESIEKAPRTVEVGGYSGRLRSEQLSRMLSTNGYFSYRGFDGQHIYSFEIENKVEILNTIDIKTKASVRKGQITIVPVIEEEINPAYQEMVANSKFLQSLERRQEKMDKFEEKLDSMAETVNTALGAADQTFSYRLNKLEGMALDGSGKPYSFKYDALTYSLYIRDLGK